MTISITQLDEMPDHEVAFKLAACCGASKWVSGMVARRPFGSRDALFSASEAVAATLSQDDWLEAFSHHPRIGQRNSNAVVSTTAESWSTGEQSAVTAASSEIRAQLADANTEYESRFGFIFIISASGRGAEEILVELRKRLSNQMANEIKIAAAEQRKITRLRLERLIT